MMENLAAVISKRLAELDRNPFEAARIGGLERSFVNDILIGKKTSVRGDKLDQLAKALDWRLSNLTGSPMATATIIPVMGQIGTGAEIYPDFEQVPDDGLFEIESTIPLPEGMIGFEVIGDSMYPRYDEGDVIICRAAGTPPKDLAPGEEAAVRTSDGHRYLKRARQSSVGFTLESHNGPPIHDVGLEWASEVWIVVRRSKWRKLNMAKEKLASAPASRPY